jgi:hypothetical protein
VIQGLVYFIRLVENPLLFKVGFTTNLRGRLRCLQTACPFDLEIFHALPGSIGDEQRIHRLLSQESRRGEWFEGELVHNIARAALEKDSLDEHVLTSWVTEELDAINDSLGAWRYSGPQTEGCN